MSPQKTRILLVEDENMLRSLYTELFEEAGYEVDTAQNGEEGLLKIQSGGYNLILLDILMPKIDGLTVLGKLTPQEFLRNGPIIMLTQLGQDSVMEKAYKGGATGCIIKSDVSPPDLLKKMEEFLVHGQE